jgi:hypothetical protein
MGNTWEVYVWKECKQWDAKYKWDYELIYAGESWVRAVLSAFRAKIHYSCIKIVWR